MPPDHRDWPLWIANEGIAGRSDERLDVLDPATGEVVGTVPAATGPDVEAAIAAAADAYPAWRRTPVEVRSRLQHAAATRIRDHADELARLLTMELGRPLAAARTEIERSADLLDYFAEEALRLHGELPLLGVPDERLMVVKVPLGVVVAIAPFNYPITLLTFKLGAAVITGNTVVAKPASDTPLSTLRLAELFAEAGYPPGVFNVVTGGGRSVGEALVSHPVPAKVAFTGSTSIGVRIHQLAAETNKRITLEMGGQCPAILFEDADLDAAIPALTRHAYANSGQFCYRVNRIYVAERRYEEFVERFAASVGNLRVGNGMLPEIDMGPLVNERILSTAAAHVEDARERGARIVVGGSRLSGPGFSGGHFFEPTVIADATHEMKILTEETFGPVVGVAPFASADDAVRLANDTVYGLAAYVFGRDLRRAWLAAEELEAGSVWVNDIHRSSNLVPFGGMKQSGLGREKSRHGLDEYLEHKTIYLGMA